MSLRIHLSYLIQQHLIFSFVTQKWAKNLKKLVSYRGISEVFWELRWVLNWIVSTTYWNTKRDLILGTSAVFRGICLLLQLVVGGVWTTHYIKGALRSASYRSRILFHTEQSFFRNRTFSARQEIPIQFTDPKVYSRIRSHQSLVSTINRIRLIGTMFA